MRTSHVIIILAGLGTVAAWEMRSEMAENIWNALSAFAVLVFAGVLHVLQQQPGVAAQRRAQLFGLGTVASFATVVSAAFVYSFIRLPREGAVSFDTLWICSGVAAGTLAAWLWLRFVRLLRQA